MTDFSNQRIFLDSREEIPESHHLEYQALEANYLNVERIAWAISHLVILILLALAVYFVAYLQSIVFISGLTLLFLGGCILHWVSDGLSFRYSGYALRKHDLHVRSGWWRRKTRVVPFSRVQHVSIDSGMIERYYGLASLSVYTAGASQADFKLRGIKESKAQEIKDWINEQIQGTA